MEGPGVTSGQNLEESIRGSPGSWLLGAARRRLLNTVVGRQAVEDRACVKPETTEQGCHGSWRCWEGWLCSLVIAASLTSPYW